VHEAGMAMHQDREGFFILFGEQVFQQLSVRERFQSPRMKCAGKDAARRGRVLL
jgi:hypothetical protein